MEEWEKQREADKKVSRELMNLCHRHLDTEAQKVGAARKHDVRIILYPHETCKRCGGSRVEAAIAGNGFHDCPDCQH